MSQRIRWNVKRSADGAGWTGTIELPTGLAFGAKGPTQRDAASKAASLASSALSNPMVQALLPPGAGLALKALKSDLGKKLLGGGLSALKSFF
jgi:hypothetical protein